MSYKGRVTKKTLTKRDIPKLHRFLFDLFGLLGKPRLPSSKSIIYQAIATQARLGWTSFKSKDLTLAHEYLNSQSGAMTSATPTT